MQKLLNMKVRLIRTKADYEAACKRIYDLMHESDEPVEPDTPEGNEIELLSLIVEKYESEHYSVGPPDPIEAIKFRMEQVSWYQSRITIKRF